MGFVQVQDIFLYALHVYATWYDARYAISSCIRAGSKGTLKYACHIVFSIVLATLLHGFPQNLRVEWYFSERSKASNIFCAYC